MCTLKHKYWLKYTNVERQTFFCRYCIHVDEVTDEKELKCVKNLVQT